MLAQSNMTEIADTEAASGGNPVIRVLEKPYIRYQLSLVILLLLGFFYVQYDNNLPLTRQWSLINSAIPAPFPEFVFLFATLPRLAMALMVGAVLGLAGSVLQQLTRNPLLSPLTLGTSLGAWLALILITVLAPGVDPDITSLVVMAGALLSVGLVLAIAGIRQLSGMPIVLAGMAFNIFLGA